MSYTVFAVVQILAAAGCMWVMMKSVQRPFWATLTMVLALSAVTGGVLRIALDVFRSDFAFYLMSVTFPFTSAAMLSLLMLTALTVIYRALSGQRL